MQLKHEFPQYISEFIGTFFLVFFGCGAVISYQIDSSSIELTSIAIAFGGAVSVMIYAVGHISGAHFNPAVTIAFWAVKRFPGFRIPGYIFSQLAGAILASSVHCMIWTQDHSYGATVASISIPGAFLVEFILSFALMFVIISVATDSRAVGELAGIAIGTTVMICAAVGGPLTGASMNPARSISPALCCKRMVQRGQTAIARRFKHGEIDNP